MDFKKYHSIIRHDKEEVADYLNFNAGSFYMSEKIDGSNLSIRLHNGNIVVASRNGDIPNENKSQFAFIVDYVAENQNIILDFFNKYPNVVIFGEYLVKHQIDYSDSKDYKYQTFYIYDIFDAETNRYLPPYCDVWEYLKLHLFNCNLDFIKLHNPIKAIETNSILEFYNKVVEKGGEGIVIKNYEYLNRYSNSQCFVKMMSPSFVEVHKHKDKKEKTLEKPYSKVYSLDSLEMLDITKFIETYCTPSRIAKAKFETIGKSYSESAQYLINDVYKEESIDIPKDINQKKLKHHVLALFK